MKAKTLFLMALVAILAACNSNNPEQNKLIGKWTEPYHVNETVKSITFDANGTAYYTEKPDTTWISIIDWGGIEEKLTYTVKKNKIYFSGEYPSHPLRGEETHKFSFATDYSIEGNTLTIDSFAYDGGIRTLYIKPLVLLKQ